MLRIYNMDCHKMEFYFLTLFFLVFVAQQINFSILYCAFCLSTFCLSNLNAPTITVNYNQEIFVQVFLYSVLVFYGCLMIFYFISIQLMCCSFLQNVPSFAYFSKMFTVLLSLNSDVYPHVLSDVFYACVVSLVTQ